MPKRARHPKGFYKVLETAVRRESRKGETVSPIHLASTVVNLRKERKLSATQLCEKAGNLNVKTLSAIETGRIKNPSFQTLQSLAQGFGFSVSDLFRHSEVQQDRNLYIGNPKGYSQMDFPAFGIKVVSFTPFVRDFFYGKVILGSKRRLDQAILKYQAPLYISMLVGKVEATVTGRLVPLREGESLFFNGILEHSFYNPLEKEAVFLLITAPSFL
jgi:transcriptional regulator with XRE-family HTH domain